MNLRWLFILIFTLHVLSCCTSKSTNNSDVKVFCAASLLPAVTAIKVEWSKNHREKIVLNAASSGILARQIENGAECDIYLAANQEWMNYLIESLQLKNQPKNIVSNQLVVCAPKDTDLDSMDIDDLLKQELTSTSNIAIADRGHVPLGKYTWQFFSYFGIENKIIKHSILTKDARSTLRLVELGEVNLGIVYLSDAITSKNVKVIAQIPPKSHEKILYSSIIVPESSSSSQIFFNFLHSNEHKSIWKNYGFIN